MDIEIAEQSAIFRVLQEESTGKQRGRDKKTTKDRQAGRQERTRFLKRLQKTVSAFGRMKLEWSVKWRDCK